MKAKHAVEDAKCPECGEMRTCEIIGADSYEGRVYRVRYLCSREHRFEVKLEKRKPMFPRKGRTG